MAPTLGGGTQDTDFNKGFTEGIFTKNLRRRNGGGQGDPDPLIFHYRTVSRLRNFYSPERIKNGKENTKNKT